MTLTNRRSAGPGVRLGYRRPPATVPAGRALAYVGSIVGLGLVLLFGVGIAAARVVADRPWPVSTALAGLTMVLAIPLVVWLARDLVHLFLFAVLPAPRPLAERDLGSEETFPPELATCVVYPVIVHDEADIDALLATMLATRERADPGPMAHVALVDFGDSARPEGERDGVLRREIEARLAATDAKPGDGSPGRAPFAALFRQRRWNPAEQLWMGWERKRGKVMEFLELVADDAPVTSFRLDRPAERALVQRLRGVRYLFTIDVGSRLTPGGLRRLVATAAHPDNAPMIDKSGEVVLGGFGLIRPHQALRVSQTLFGWIMYSGPSVRPSPSIGQQMLGHDVFFGQGLIDVAAMRTTVRGHIPENSVLSHDKLEGIHAGAACQTEVALIDMTPPDYLTFRQRMHRWIRGDYHLVAWVVGRGVGPGTLGPRSLSLFGRWLLAEDLLGHSHSLSALAMFLLGWLVAPAGLVGPWTVVVLALLLESVVTEPLTYLVRRREPGADRSRRWAVVVRAFTAEAIRWMLWVVLLADRALVTADAAVRAVYRTAISDRHVLQWTSFAHMSRGADTSWRGWWWSMWPGPTLAVVTAGLLGLANPAALPWATPLLVAWTAAPAVARWASRPRSWLPEPAP